MSAEMTRLGDAMDDARGTLAEIRSAIERRTGRRLEPETPQQYADRQAREVTEVIATLRERGRAQQLAWALTFSSGSFRRRTFATFEAKPENRAALAEAHRVVRGERRGIALVGENGVGKGHLIAAIANEAVRRGEPAVDVSLIDLLRRVKDSYHRQRDEIEDPQARAMFGMSESSIVRRCATIPFLGIEDVGKPSVTAWMLQTLFAIVDARYENDLGIALSSNTDLPDLLTRWQRAARHLAERGEDLDLNLPDAIVDRLIEMTQAPAIIVRGESRRGADVAASPPEAEEPAGDFPTEHPA